MESFYAKQVEKEFFQSRFDGERELRLFLTGALTDASQAGLIRKLNSLARDFSDAHKQDMNEAAGDRTHVGLLLAVRPWTLAAFKRLRSE